MKGDNDDYDVQVRRNITIYRDAPDLYREWRVTRKLARFVAGVQPVETIDGRRSRWSLVIPGWGEKRGNPR